MKKKNENKITVITGKRGAGKTRFCALQEMYAREQGRQAAGVLSPALYQNGKKVGFYLKNLESGEQRLGGSSIFKPETSFDFHQWNMDRESFDWANDFLSKIQSCDLLIIDELGPLEFEHHAGLIAALDCLKTVEYKKALVVIRPELIAAFKALEFDFDTSSIA